MMAIDKKFRVPRIWSNAELRKFGHFCSGRVANVSGWKDEDKEGQHYRSYFTNADEYWISNFKSEMCGYQGDLQNEVFLDLAQPCTQELREKFDVVFNHTVLEHVFEVDAAFTNLCAMSKELVIVVVPFLQEQHAEYGDYWRFTPQAVDKLFEKNGFKTLYINYNDVADASIYVFAIGARHPERWSPISSVAGNRRHLIYREMVGTQIIRVPLWRRLCAKVKACAAEQFALKP